MKVNQIIIFFLILLISSCNGYFQEEPFEYEEEITLDFRLNVTDITYSEDNRLLYSKLYMKANENTRASLDIILSKDNKLNNSDDILLKSKEYNIYYSRFLTHDDIRLYIPTIIESDNYYVFVIINKKRKIKETNYKNNVYLSEEVYIKNVCDMEFKMDRKITKMQIKDNYIYSVRELPFCAWHLFNDYSYIDIFHFNNTTKSINYISNYRSERGHKIFTYEISRNKLYANTGVAPYSYKLLDLVNISDKSNPRFVKWQGATYYDSYYPVDNIVYFAYENDDLIVRDYDTKYAKSIYETRIPGIINYPKMIIKNNNLIILCSDIVIYDITTKEKPVHKINYDSPIGDIKYFAVNGNELYITNNGTKLCQLNISDNTNPIIKNNITFDNYIANVKIQNNYLFVHENKKIHIYDISNPEIINFINSIDINFLYYYEGWDIENNYIFISNEVRDIGNYLHIIDWIKYIN